MQQQINILETWYYIASILVVLISLFSLGLSIANRKNISGTMEIEIRNMINSSISQLENICINMLNNNKEDCKVYQKLIESAHERILNSYDEACMKYLDKKIDRIRFKKTYRTEIRNLVKSEENKKYFGPGGEYQAIQKVYEMWNKTEK